jgi:hypothetical protein
MRNDFQKDDCQGENPFATPRFAGFPLDPLSENSHSVAAQGGEMTHWGARTRQIGTFPVNRENISPAQNAGLPEGSGTGFLHKKRVPGITFICEPADLSRAGISISSASFIFL